MKEAREVISETNGRILLGTPLGTINVHEKGTRTSVLNYRIKTIALLSNGNKGCLIEKWQNIRCLE